MGEMEREKDALIGLPLRNSFTSTISQSAADKAMDCFPNKYIASIAISQPEHTGLHCGPLAFPRPSWQRPTKRPITSWRGSPRRTAEKPMRQGMPLAVVKSGNY